MPKPSLGSGTTCLLLLCHLEHCGYLNDPRKPGANGSARGQQKGVLDRGGIWNSELSTTVAAGSLYLSLIPALSHKGTWWPFKAWLENESSLCSPQSPPFP